MNGPGKRLDVLLVERRLFPTRERARGAVMAGIVFVDGRRITKAGTRVGEGCRVEVKGELTPFVSRGGVKLQHALERFQLDVRGKVAVDIGASTGGFTDCLLTAGAARVFAVDVGYGQLAWKLRQDPRVVVLERTNARYLERGDFDPSPELAVIDVAFISLTKILPAVARILAPQGVVVALVKPQFEAGPGRVGRKGVVKDPETHREILAQVITGGGREGFCWHAMTWSPLLGPEGNIEFFLDLRHTGARSDPQVPVAEIAALVAAAHRQHYPSSVD